MTGLLIDLPIEGERFWLLGNEIPLRVSVHKVEMVEGALCIRLLIDSQGGKVYVIGDSIVNFTAAQFVLARQNGKLVPA